MTFLDSFVVGLGDKICDIHRPIHAMSRNGELCSIAIFWTRRFIRESWSILHWSLINILYC